MKKLILKNFQPSSGEKIRSDAFNGRLSNLEKKYEHLERELSFQNINVVSPKKIKELSVKEMRKRKIGIYQKNNEHKYRFNIKHVI